MSSRWHDTDAPRGDAWDERWRKLAAAGRGIQDEATPERDDYPYQRRGELRERDQQDYRRRARRARTDHFAVDSFGVLLGVEQEKNGIPI